MGRCEPEINQVAFVVELALPSGIFDVLESQQLIQHRLETEIELGVLKDSTREELLTIAKGMIEQDDIEGVILGCTELPLILTQTAYDGVPFLNTAAIHVNSIVETCRG